MYIILHVTKGYAKIHAYNFVNIRMGMLEYRVKITI